jgi:hypothetical protein
VTVETLRQGPPLQLGGLGSFGCSRITLGAPSSPFAPSLGGSSSLGERLRIAHLSDFHLRPGWREAFDRLLLDVRTSEPDLVCVTGDWVEDKFDPKPALPTARRLAEQLARLTPLGAVSCLGNHDGDLLAPYLIDAGIRVLCNQSAELTTRGQTVEVVGLAGVARLDLDERFLDRLEPTTRSDFRIILSHYPDVVLHLEPIRADAILVGHTHGGQVCLPGGRAIITHDSLPRRMARGVHATSPGPLIVNRGLGVSGYPIRLFCPPEWLIVDLMPDRAGFARKDGQLPIHPSS